MVDRMIGQLWIQLLFKFIQDKLLCSFVIHDFLLVQLTDKIKNGRKFKIPVKI
jgi:hypothetical protein